MGAAIVPYTFTAQKASGAESKNDRLSFASIGVGGRGTQLMQNASKFGDIVAVCDVDRNHAESAKERAGGKADIYEDYRKLLERKDIDAVTIGTRRLQLPRVRLAKMSIAKSL